MIFLFVETDPEKSVVKSIIKFYSLQPDFILSQPSLASHAVLKTNIDVTFA